MIYAAAGMSRGAWSSRGKTLPIIDRSSNAFFFPRCAKGAYRLAGRRKGNLELILMATE